MRRRKLGQYYNWSLWVVVNNYVKPESREDFLSYIRAFQPFFEDNLSEMDIHKDFPIIISKIEAICTTLNLIPREAPRQMAMYLFKDSKEEIEALYDKWAKTLKQNATCQLPKPLMDYIRRVSDSNNVAQFLFDAVEEKLQRDHNYPLSFFTNPK